LQIKSAVDIYLPSSYKKKRHIQNCIQNENKLSQVCTNFSLSSCDMKGLNYFIKSYTNESVGLIT
jgi:hypothetical protein